MPLSAAQNRRYRALWEPVRQHLRKLNPGITAAQIDQNRRMLHEMAGLPDSSRDFSNADLTKWEETTLEAVDPLNPQLRELRARIAAGRHPHAGTLWHIRRLLRDLDKSPAYAAAIAARNGFHDLPADLDLWPRLPLQRVLFALSRNARQQQTKTNHNV